MQAFGWRFAAISMAVLVSACGGGDGDKAHFTTVVSFGDSYSDAGTYKVGTVAALGGGKFTVNGPDGLTWTEVLAKTVGAPAQCAAQTGMLPNNGTTGAPVRDSASCYNYAQGSARIGSSGTGPNGVALQAALGQKNLGFMAISLKEQFQAHLAKAGGYYRTDLVTVNGGGNDVFVQLAAVDAAAGGGAAAVATGTVAGWPQATLDVVAQGGAPAVQAVGAAAVAAMGQAGAELAADINALVLAKRARYVLVRNLGDINVTPDGLALDAATRGLVTAMTQAFNSKLGSGLAGSTGVIVYDDYQTSHDITADPAKFGLSNVTTPACGPNAFGQPVGPSIVCNAGNLIGGDTSRYAFADGVHPTPYVHRLTAQRVMTLMQQAGWQ
ncbi:MAG TPA: SGNH/GDSL hydrolase family protein [Rubrivivax sp.]|nr:SGNH/GDSL hydrolase family protein [Rubrivivax sp.]HPO19340.1 SGNH/GDSL hydrolase family protein [Rubrivivax sp.]